MNRFSVPFRLASGFTILLANVALVLHYAGFVPHASVYQRQAASQVAQIVASTASSLLEQRDGRTLGALADGWLAGSGGLQRIVVRGNDGSVLHDASRSPTSGPLVSDGSIESVVVPVFARGRRWGTVQMQFDLPQESVVASPIALIALVSLIVWCVCYFYMCRLFRGVDRLHEELAAYRQSRNVTPPVDRRPSSLSSETKLRLIP